MALSVRDFRAKNASGAKNLGNVHVLVEDYVRDQQGRAIAVQGVNLKDGNEVVIKLADAERFARLYLNPNQDMNLRVQIAEQQIAKRTQMREIGAARGNKAVPIGGVMSISNVRPDLESGELYGRWPNAVVTDPEKEMAMPAVFEIRTTVSKNAEGKEFKTAFIQAYSLNDALPAEKVDRAALDRMLSGQLTNTGAELRTNLAVTVQLGDETATYAFRPKMAQTESGYATTKSVEEALSGKITRLSEAAAAVAIAAKADIPFEKLDIVLPNAAGDKRGELLALYEGVKDGTVPATFIPGATLQPSRFTVDAILGRKLNNEGKMVEVKTPEQDLTDRGFVKGVLGVRYVSNETGEIVQPVVKAVFPDSKLPQKDSDYFVRYDLSSVGYDAFLATQQPASDNAPKLGHMEKTSSSPSPSAPVEPDQDFEADDPENQTFTYGDSAPEF